MTDPFETARNASAGMPGHSMSADVGVLRSQKMLRDALAQDGLTLGDGFKRHPLYSAAIRALDAALNAPTESVKAPEGVTQADREAAADLLDEIPNLTDHYGICKIADLIRDGEYDEHEATIAFMRHRLAASPAPITADDAVAKEREPVWAKHVRQALGFYASHYYPGAWVQPVTPDASYQGIGRHGHRPDGPPRPSEALLEDQGRIARDALAAIRSLSPDTEGEGM